MKQFKLLWLLGLSCLSSVLYSQNAPVSTIGSAATYGTSQVIPITVVNFVNIRSAKYTINFDPAIANVPSSGGVTLGPGISGNMSYSVNSGTLIISWFTFQGLTYPDNSVFLNINFTKVGNGTTNLLFDDGTGFGCRFLSGSIDLNDQPTSTYYIPGVLSFLSDTDAPKTYLPTLTNQCPGAVSIPVTVDFFNAIGAVDLRMSYNSSAMSYSSFTNNSGFPGLNVTTPSAGVIQISGISTNPAGHSYPNGSTLLTLNFNYTGGLSNLLWVDNGTSCEYKNKYPTYTVLNDIPTGNYYFNGAVQCTTQVPVWTTQPGALDVFLPCNDLSGLPAALALVPAATAACGMSVTVSLVTDNTYPGPCPGMYTRVRTWSATDQCNNAAAQNFTQTITVGINTPPAQPAPAGSTVQCLSQAGPPTPPTVSDQCGNPVTPGTPQVVDNPNPLTCQGTRQYIYTYTDCANNQVTWTYTYTIVLNTPPVVPPDGSSTVQCVSLAGPPVTPVVTDACGRNIIPVLLNTIDNLSPDGCSGKRTYVYTYTDCANNSSTWKYLYTILLTTPPPVPADGASTVECVADATTPQLPDFSDFCGRALSPVLVSVVDDPDPISCDGTRTYTWEITDCANNTSTWKYVYTILRSTPPAESGNPVSSSSSLQCISGTPPPPAQLPVVEDVCGNVLSPAGVVYDNSGFNGCEGEIKYKYTYTDCQNLQFVWTYTYIIDRTVAPAEVGGPVPNTTSLECAAGIAPPTQLPVVQDVCGNTLTATGPSYDDSGFNGCEGTIKYVYTYTDCANLQFEWTYSYVITHTTPPSEFGGPVTNTLTVSCPGDAVPPVNLPVVRDVCGVTLTPPQPQQGGTFVDCEGTITYTYNYLDCAGLPFTWVFTYNIVRSGLNPPAEVGGPVPVSAIIACPSGAVTPLLPVVKDECGITLTPPQPVVVQSITDCNGTITYTYNYADCKNQLFTWVFTYYLQYQDFTITPQSGGSVVSCPNQTDVVPTPPTVYDNCGLLITPTGPVVSAKPTCNGTRTYTWTYTDCALNSHDWTYTYTVVYSGGLQPPQNGFTTVACVSQAVNPGSPPDITDACGRTVSAQLVGVAYSPDPLTCEGTVIWTYRYTACDNTTADWTYTYTVQYLDFTITQQPGGSLVSCPDETDVVPTPPAVYDNCGLLIVPGVPIVSPKPTCNGTRTYTWTYTDCAFNSHDWVYTYTVLYSGGLTAPPDDASTVTCLAQAVDPGAPAAITDACGRTVSAQLVGVTYSPDPLTCEGTVVWTYRYTACDNTTTADWTYTYTVDLDVPPVVPSDGGSVVACVANATTPLPPVVTDQCGRAVQPFLESVVDDPPQLSCEGTRVYTYSYTDCAQNVSYWKYTYTIIYQDFSVPTGAGSTVACPAATDVVPTPPTVYDNCGILIVPGVPVVSPKPTCNGTRTYTWTYTDCDNNSHDWTYTYTVVYPGGLIPPQPGFATVACRSQAVDPGPPPAILDDCGRSVTPVFEGSYTVPDPLTCQGSVIWLYSYTSCDGITKVYWSFTYTIQYQDFSIAQQPGSSTVTCPNETDILPTPPVVHDNCGVTLTASGPSDSGKPSCNGIRTYTWTYTDCAQNSHDWVYTYTVLYSGSLTAPPDDASTVTCLAQAVDPGPPADITDACGRAVSAQLVGVVYSPDPITCEGTVVWTYRYTACDNITTVDWKYTYTIDLATPPAVPANGGSTVECLADATTPQPPVVTDACGNSLTAVLIGFNDDPPQITCEGTRTYNFSYTDCAQNTSYWSYVYTVDLSTPPVVPANGTLVIATPAFAVPPVTPVVTDACGNSLTAQLISVVDNPDPIISSGTRTYTYEYTDCANNTSVWTFTYTIDPSMAPPLPPDGGSVVACVAAAVLPVPPVYTDVCNLPVTPVYLGYTDVPSPVTCEGTRMYEWSYTDCNSYTQYWKYTYTIQYLDFTIAQQPGGSVVSCPDATDAVPNPPTVYDNCNLLIVPGVPIVSPKPNCNGIRTYTWTYTDCANNSHDWTYTYTVVYSGGLQPPQNGFSTVACVSQAVNPGAPPDITDACGRTVSAQLVGVAYSPDPLTCEGTVVWTYRYTACDNTTTADWTYTYTVQYLDFTITQQPGGSLVSCPDETDVVPTPPAVYDNCGLLIVPGVPIVSPKPTCNGTRTYTWTYTDCALNSHDWVYTYTVLYSGGLTAPPDDASTVTCLAQAVDPGAPADITDACGRTVSAQLVGVTYSPDPLTCEGTVVWTYRYTACDNTTTADWTYTYTVDLDVPPAVPSDGGSVVACISNATTPVPPVVTDQCGRLLQPFLVSVVDDPPQLSCEGTRVYTYSYTDCAQNVSYWKYTYTIIYQDFSVPAGAGSTVACPAATDVVPNPPTIYDNCGILIVPGVPIVSPKPTCNGTRTYTWTYTDCDNNSHDWTYTYTVVYSGGLQPPQNGSSTVACVSQAVDTGAPADITDACGRTVSAQFVGVAHSPDPLTCEGTVVWTYRYTACDNTTADWTYTYTVQYLDFTIPQNQGTVVSCPDATDIVPTPPTVYDNCGLLIVPGVPIVSSKPTCNGTRTYTWTYTDCAQNSHDWVYTYTVLYSGGLTAPPDDASTVTCLAQAVDPGAPADITDACGRNVSPQLVGVSYSPDPLTCEGTVVWTYRYTACDNTTTADWKYTYTVDLSTPPAVPANGGSTVECLADATTPLPPVVTDACGNSLTAVFIGFNDDPSQITCEGTRTYNFSYTDCAQNISYWSYVYNIDLSTPPAVPANGTLVVASAGQAVPPVTPTVTDACGNPLTAQLISVVDNPDPIITSGTRTYTYEYTDCANNTSVWTFTYTIDPSMAPPLPPDASSVVPCVADATLPTPPSYTDVCNLPVTPLFLGYTDVPSPITCEGTRVYEWSYTDCNSYTQYWKYTYTIQYQDFTITPQSGGSVVSCPDETDVVPTPPTVYDNCGLLIVPGVPIVSSKPTCNGTRTYTWTYTDCANNSHDWTYTYTVVYSGGLQPPQNGFSTVACVSQAVNPGAPADITDACGRTVSAQFVGVDYSPDPLTCEGTVVWTYRYTACDNTTTADWTYTYTVQYLDFTITQQPGGSVVSCPDATDVVPTPPVVYDNCGLLIVPGVPIVTQKPTCNGTRTYTWTYTDCALNSHDWVYTYTVLYSGGLTAPSNAASTVTCLSQAVDPGAPADITDACGRTVSAQLVGVTYSPDPLTCEGTVVWTYRYTACDNTTTADWTYTYTVDLDVPPAVPSDGGSVVACITDATPPATPAITDQCGRALQPFLESVVDDPAQLSCEGTRVYTYSYTDCAQNVSYWKYTYTILYQDFTVPAGVSSTVSCPDETDVVPNPPTVYDNCGILIVPGVPIVSPKPTCNGTRTYTWTYTDCANNSHDWTYTYNVMYSGGLVAPQDDASTVTCLSQAVDPGAPADISDACGRTVSAQLVGVSYSPDPLVCEGTAVWTYRYTACDNTTTADWKYTYTIDLATPPVVPPNAGAIVPLVSLAVPPATPVVTDACGNSLTAVLVSMVDQPDPITTSGVRVYTYEYTDCAQNTSVWTFTYVVDPSTIPVFPPDAGSTVECADDAVMPLPPVYIDLCSQLVTPVYLGVVNTPDPIVCEGTRSYSWSYTDCNNQTNIWTYTYTIDLSTPPVVPANGTATVECLVFAIAPLTPQVSDHCGRPVNPVLQTVVNLPQPLTCEGQRVYTYAYKDCAQNTSLWKFTYNIDRTTPPAPVGAPVPVASVVNCYSQVSAPTQLPVVRDVCGTTLNPAPPVIGGTYNGCEGTVTYTYNYADCSGLQYQWVYTWNVVVTAGPVVPQDGLATVECIAGAVPPVTPVVYDQCGNLITPVPVNVVYSPDPFLCEGSVTYIYSYTDCAQNTSLWSYKYIIDLNTFPVVPPPGSSTVPFVSMAVPPAIPSVTDACGNTLTAQLISVVDNPDPIVVSGIRTYTYAFVDCAGNTSTWTYTYTVDPNLIPPFPADDGSVVECPADAVMPVPPPYTDVCNNPVVPVFAGVTSTPDPVTCTGTKVYTFTYTDCLNQVFTWNYTYTIDLTTPPVVPANGSATVYCPADAVPPVLPVVEDHCGNTLTATLISITDNPDPLSCNGSRTYMYEFADCASNVVNWSFTYTVVRVSPPVEDGGPVSSTGVVECLAQAVPPAVLPVVKDACGNILQPSAPVMGGSFNGCFGTRSYTYTYTDCANLQFVWTFTWNIAITTPPVLPPDGASVVECVTMATNPVPPQVTDACGNPVQPVLFNVSNSPFPLTCEGQRTYTYSYTDCAFNTVYWNYVYTIQRTIPPAQSGNPVPDQANVQCVADAVPPPQLPVVTDVCGIVLTPGNPVQGGTYSSCSGTVTYTYNYVDCANLTYQWVFTYFVNDQTPPVISCTSDQQRTLALGQTVYTAAGTEFDPVSFSDNCGIAFISNNLNGQPSLNGYQFPVGITNVVWTVTDECGNTSSCSFVVEVVSLTYSGCLDLKVFLQGPFDPVTGLMFDSLRTKNFIPVSEPYSSAPYSTHFTHTGGGGGEIIPNPTAVFAVTGPDAIVDWVFVELRDKTDSSLVLYTKSALIQRDGDVVDVDGFSQLCFVNMPDNQYYVAVRHRNHLGIMTAGPVQIVPAGTLIDFRYGQQPEFDFGTTHPNGVNYTGLAQKQVTINTRAMFAGNATVDIKLKYQGAGNERGTILSQVLNYPTNLFLESNYSFAFGYFSGDTNMDGQVKYQGAGNDAGIILNNVLNYTTGSSQSYDFMIEQLP